MSKNPQHPETQPSETQPSENQPQNHEPVSCASCSSPATLVVTVAYDPGRRGGRLLAYCLPCREALADHIQLAIPIGLVDDEAFVRLYEEDYTRSDPHMSTLVVFGRRREDLMTRVLPFVKPPS